MLAKPITDSRAWTAATVGRPDEWRTELPPECVRELEDLTTRADPVTDFRLHLADVPLTAEALSDLKAELVEGRGFGIIEGIDVSDPQLGSRIYWALGQILGSPFEQNIQGALLYDVKDTGQDVSRGARFSVTNAESSFHTDRAFGEVLPDFVGLLCLQTAMSGGQSQLVSAYALHNTLLEKCSDALEALYGSFLIDKRGQVRGNEPAQLEAPIFAWDRRVLTMRYLRYYIEVGHREAERPLTPAEEKAIDAVDDLLTDPRYRVEFSLQKGQVLFTNNRWILHNRTAFEDHPDPDRRRHYVRLWLSRN